MTGILPEDRYFTTREAAELLGVTAPTVINWVNQGRLDAFRTPGGHRRIPQASLASFARACGKEIPGLPLVQAAQNPRLTRVLVIDNETDFAEMIVEFLNLQDGVYAQSSIEPIDVGYQLASLCPDVVLCSVDVPGVPPRAIVQRLTHCDGRLYILTTLKTTHDESMAADLGLEGVVEKSIKLEELLKLITQ